MPGGEREVRLALPSFGLDSRRDSTGLLARIDRPLRWLTALCLAASSGGCLLSKDIPDAALDVPPSYRSGGPADPDAPPTLDWWRGFGAPELTVLMEEAQR